MFFNTLVDVEEKLYKFQRRVVTILKPLSVRVQKDTIIKFGTTMCHCWCMIVKLQFSCHFCAIELKERWVFFYVEYQEYPWGIRYKIWGQKVFLTQHKDSERIIMWIEWVWVVVRFPRKDYLVLKSSW